ncbi:MAG: glycine cleavage system protein GcvH [Gammaproteobacteria bacterium]|nr:glycine cleavage system protein GcvH [Gammaproteobacteria bacterium]
MSNVPSELRYLSSHEWVAVDGDIATVGISEHAQGLLGDLVFVELPEVGDELGAGDEAAVVESVKAASDVYAPISGEIIEVNEDLEDSPEIINADAFGDGWIYKIKMSDPDEFKDLMDATSYAESIAEDDE